MTQRPGPDIVAPRRSGERRPRRSPVVLLALVAALTLSVSACVSTPNAEKAKPVDQSPDGPACRAAASVRTRLEGTPEGGPDVDGAVTALQHLRDELPAGLQPYVTAVLSEDGPADGGRTRSEVAWIELREWSVTMCGSSLVPSWARPSVLEVEEGTPTTIDTTDLPSPPPLVEVLETITTAHGDAAGWWNTEGLTGAVSGEGDLVSVTLVGVPTKKEALSACQDLVEELAGPRPVHAVVRGPKNELLAFTEVPDTCRLARTA